MRCSGSPENPNLSIKLIQIQMANFQYNLFGCIRQPWALFIEQQEINMFNELIIDERVGFLVPILTQDANIHMDREICCVPAHFHSNKDISGTNDVQ
jgi:hypothetical protein